MKNKSKGAIVRAKITYFFKETFRAHSKAEYREIFSRGLNEDNGGVTGSYPWLYVRAFFALFILFTINTLVLRLTNNTLYVPSVTFLGGVTVTIPFIVLLFELYPKRDVSLFLIMAVLVIGGTVSGVLAQIGYYFIKPGNAWTRAVLAGFLEEICKALPAVVTILILKQKNPYACFLFAAAVGAGFSIIEDMGYIFYYSDKYAFFYHSDIQATVMLFVDRGMSAFCTHILWTGAIGWGFSISKRPLKSIGLLIFISSVAMHVCWDLPFDNWIAVADICLCVLVAAIINIAIVHKSRINTLAAEVDLTQENYFIIREAKAMGELTRFRNAANLTFALTCTLLSVIILALCALPIGMKYHSVEYENRSDFIEYVQGGYNLKANWTRAYKTGGHNVEERFIDNGNGELVLSYVVQSDIIKGYDGVYYYGYYLNSDGTGEIDSITVELEDDEMFSRVNCVEYVFGNQVEYAFGINDDKIIEYTYNLDGTVTAVLNTEEFEGYDFLIALCAAGCAIAAACTVILITFRVILRRVFDEEM